MLLFIFYFLNLGFCTEGNFQNSSCCEITSPQKNRDTEIIILRVQDLFQEKTDFKSKSCLFLEKNFSQFKFETFESLMGLELSFFQSLNPKENYLDSSFLKTLLKLLKEYSCEINPYPSKVQDLANRLFEAFISPTYIFEKKLKGFEKTYRFFSAQEFLLQLIEGPWLLEKSLLETFGLQLFKFKEEEEKETISFYSWAFWQTLVESVKDGHPDERASNFQVFHDLFSELYFKGQSINS